MANILTKQSLDRFSCPLYSERGDSFFLRDAIQEQNELNKKHLVMDYLEAYWNKFSLVPTVEHVSEALYKIDLDQDMIKTIIKEF